MPPILTVKKTAILLIFLLSLSSWLGAQVIGKVEIDQTGSLNQSARDTGLRMVSQSLVEITRELAITDWEFTVFSDDGWTASPFFTTTVAPYQPPNCSAAEPSEAARWFKGVSEAERRSSEDNCQRMRRDYTAHYEADVATKLRPAREELEKARPVVADRCTAFWDVIEAVGHETRPSLTIVVSDAVETCRNKPPKLEPPNSSARVFVLLLPSVARYRRGATQAEQYDVQKAEILKHAPWVTVVPVTGFSPVIFKNQHITQAALAAGNK